MWSKKYEPENWDEWLGNEDVKENFQDKKTHELISYIFAGPAGTGKSLAGRLIAKQHFKRNTLILNASKEGIDVVKGRIDDFCKGGSVDGSKIKCIILEEFDGFTKPAQKALRHPMEKFAERIKIIGTCNNPEKIIDPLHSRACTIRFQLASNDDLKRFLYRIVEGEKLKITEEQAKEIIKDARGKFRNVANLLQGWTTGGIVKYKVKDDLHGTIKKIFNHMKKLQNEAMLKAIDQAIGEYDSTTILIRLGEMIKESKMPPVLKSSCIIACGECMEQLVTGVDIYIAFWSLCSKLFIVYKKLSAVKK